MTKLSRRQFSVTLGVVAAGGLVLPARAHHGWGGYDSTQLLNLQGQIIDYKYINPHGELRLRTADKVWLCTLAPPFRMQNRGLTEEFFKVGAVCLAVGYPSKSDPNEMRAERITVSGKTVELR